ncbi:helix-turn-helix domain-containing protein [Zhouia sp. PK063]|uniref:helix-turn-helix domain-containing protein n=1 Tax=Zhouia sp. PK063 TaxID=3373602 RepID=UPI0037960B55
MLKALLYKDYGYRLITHNTNPDFAALADALNHLAQAHQQMPPTEKTSIPSTSTPITFTLNADNIITDTHSDALFPSSEKALIGLPFTSLLCLSSQQALTAILHTLSLSTAHPNPYHSDLDFQITPVLYYHIRCYMYYTPTQVVITSAPPTHSTPTQATPATTLKAKIQEITDYIDAHLDGSLPRTQAIAHRFGWNEKKLVQLFKIIHRQSPSAYYQQQRMKKARQLLLHTDMPLEEIATTIGYHSTNSFYKAFKKYYHHPPSRLRHPYCKNKP